MRSTTKPKGRSSRLPNEAPYKWIIRLEGSQSGPVLALTTYDVDASELGRSIVLVSEDNFFDNDLLPKQLDLKGYEEFKKNLIDFQQPRRIATAKYVVANLSGLKQLQDAHRLRRVIHTHGVIPAYQSDALVTVLGLEGKEIACNVCVYPQFPKGPSSRSAEHTDIVELKGYEIQLDLTFKKFLEDAGWCFYSAMYDNGLASSIDLVRTAQAVLGGSVNHKLDHFRDCRLRALGRLTSSTPYCTSDIEFVAAFINRNMRTIVRVESVYRWFRLLIEQYLRALGYEPRSEHGKAASGPEFARVMHAKYGYEIDEVREFCDSDLVLQLVSRQIGSRSPQLKHRDAWIVSESHLWLRYAVEFSDRLKYVSQSGLDASKLHVFVSQRNQLDVDERIKAVLKDSRRSPIPIEAQHYFRTGPTELEFPTEIEYLVWACEVLLAFFEVAPDRGASYGGSTYAWLLKELELALSLRSHEQALVVRVGTLSADDLIATTREFGRSIGGADSLFEKPFGRPKTETRVRRLEEFLQRRLHVQVPDGTIEVARHILVGGAEQFLARSARNYCVQTLFRWYALLPERAGRQYRRLLTQGLTSAGSSSINRAFGRPGDAARLAGAVNGLPMIRHGSEYHLLKATQQSTRGKWSFELCLREDLTKIFEGISEADANDVYADFVKEVEGREVKYPSKRDSPE